jgi:small-conductance mechanosensitive channel
MGGMDDFFIAHRIQFIESAAAIAVFIGIKAASRWLVRGAVLRLSYKAKEEREVMRLLRLLLILFLSLALTAIWGVKQNEILLFAASAVTVLGVAFFAEMSVLSNITAFLVLFFQHPMKIGDRIRLKDGEHETEGELVDITYFFTFVRKDDGAMITVPNAALMKNSFTIVAHQRH